GDAASLPAIDPQSNRDEGGDVRIGELTSGTTQQEYEQNVRRVLEYIRSGDIFQANISRRISGAMAGSPRELFIAMLDGMAPWFGALIEGPTAGRAVISASPELFLRVTAGDGRIRTRPIKGTAPGDAAAASLSSSEKDQSELAMIVDLMRNDLGR